MAKRKKKVDYGEVLRRMLENPNLTPEKREELELALNNPRELFRRNREVERRVLTESLNKL